MGIARLVWYGKGVSQKASQPVLTPRSVQGNNSEDPLSRKAERDKGDSRAADDGVISGGANRLNTTEQQPGRKGLSSKLNAIREKYTPAEGRLTSPR